jgi:hypothetical protein
MTARIDTLSHTASVFFAIACTAVALIASTPILPLA